MIPPPPSRSISRPSPYARPSSTAHHPSSSSTTPFSQDTAPFPHQTQRRAIPHPHADALSRTVSIPPAPSVYAPRPRAFPTLLTETDTQAPLESQGILESLPSPPAQEVQVMYDSPNPSGGATSRPASVQSTRGYDAGGEVRRVDTWGPPLGTQRGGGGETWMETGRPRTAAQVFMQQQRAQKEPKPSEKALHAIADLNESIRESQESAATNHGQLRDQLHDLRTVASGLPTREDIVEAIEEQVLPTFQDGMAQLNDKIDFISETFAQKATDLVDTTASRILEDIKILGPSPARGTQQEKGADIDNTQTQPLMTLINHLIGQLEPIAGIVEAIRPFKALPDAARIISDFKSDFYSSSAPLRVFSGLATPARPDIGSCTGCTNVSDTLVKLQASVDALGQKATAQNDMLKKMQEAFTATRRDPEPMGGRSTAGRMEQVLVRLEEWAKGSATTRAEIQVPGHQKGGSQQDPQPGGLPTPASQQGDGGGNGPRRSPRLQQKQAEDRIKAELVDEAGGSGQLASSPGDGGGHDVFGKIVPVQHSPIDQQQQGNPTQAEQSSRVTRTAKRKFASSSTAQSDPPSQTTGRKRSSDSTVSEIYDNQQPPAPKKSTTKRSASDTSKKSTTSSKGKGKAKPKSAKRNTTQPEPEPSSSLASSSIPVNPPTSEIFGSSLTEVVDLTGSSHSQEDAGAEENVVPTQSQSLSLSRLPPSSFPQSQPLPQDEPNMPMEVAVADEHPYSQSQFDPLTPFSHRRPPQSRHTSMRANNDHSELTGFLPYAKRAGSARAWLDWSGTARESRMRSTASGSGPEGRMVSSSASPPHSPTVATHEPEESVDRSGGEAESSLGQDAGRMGMPGSRRRTTEALSEDDESLEEVGCGEGRGRTSV